jgi:deoxyribodipyrimidine photo-lyase
MVITSFMAKHCQLDPKWIEKWWANHLVDYNIASTNGGVAWTAGYGTDSMIAQRIFAYWTQSLKFDSKAEFIKHWLPEYKDVEPKHIHNWEEYNTFNKPIFSHKERREEYIKFLKKNKL